MNKTVHWWFSKRISTNGIFGTWYLGFLVDNKILEKFWLSSLYVWAKRIQNTDFSSMESLLTDIFPPQLTISLAFCLYCVSLFFVFIYLFLFCRYIFQNNEISLGTCGMKVAGNTWEWILPPSKSSWTYFYVKISDENALWIQFVYPSHCERHMRSGSSMSPTIHILITYMYVYISMCIRVFIYIYVFISSRR